LIVMAHRPEHVAPPEIFYNEAEAKKYARNSRMMEIQERLTERALELLALPDDGVPKLLLDIGCGSGMSGETLSEHGHMWVGTDISRAMLDVAAEREVEGDLFLGDMGQGLPFRPAMFDGAVSISAVQWLCNADSTGAEPRVRLKRFFTSLYNSLSRGGRAVLQLYPETPKQAEMITMAAMRAGFSGGLVVDYPNSTRAKKYFLTLMAGPPAEIPKPKGISGSASEDSEAEDGIKMSGRVSGKRRKGDDGKASTGGKCHPDQKGKAWILKKKEIRRKRGYMDVKEDTKYTGRKRKSKALS